VSGFDPIARGLGVRAASLASLLATRSIGNIGQRCFGGRTANIKVADTVGRTFEVLTALAAPFDAIQIGIVTGQTLALDAVTPNIRVAIAPVSDTTDATMIAAPPIVVTFGGVTSIVAPPSATRQRRNIIWSDWTPCASVPRTDGGALPLIAIRTSVTMAAGTGNIVMTGNGTDSFANFATHPSGRIWRMVGKSGQFATLAAWASMQSSNATVENGAPSVLIRYLSRGKVVNVACFGDSIAEGRGTYLEEGFGFPACVALSANSAGIAYEYSNLAWAGQTMSQVRDNVIDAMAAGISCDVAYLPCGSPNDGGPPITAASIVAQRGCLAIALQALVAKKIEPIVGTWIPTNSVLLAFGATDSLRRGYNDEVRGWAGRGSVVADFDAAMAGVPDASTQVQVKAGMTTDNIHPNDAGNALMTATLVKAIGRVIAPAAGLLAR
jgi:hypothetical protein